MARARALADLGVKKKKKKTVKISEKFRFAFDWNNEEDTSVDLNPLYEKKYRRQARMLQPFTAPLTDPLVPVVAGMRRYCSLGAV